MWAAISLLVGAVFTRLSVMSWRRRRAPRRWMRWVCRAGAPVGALLAVICFGAAGYLWWYTHRSQPGGGREALFHGVAHVVETRRAPRPMVIHVVEIDLKAEGVSFLVTPPGGSSGTLKARKTSTFLDEFGVQVAINANYYFPFRSNSIFDYYPHEGDAVEVCGYAASRGNVYSEKKWMPGTLFISERNEASFEEPVGDVYNAIAGNGFLVRDGAVAGRFEDDRPYPRAGLGLDAGRRRLFFFVIDGKQPNYSEGATLSELAGVMREYGVHDGIRLDEGGSSTIVVREPEGKARVVNSPINHRLPYFERVVANHLGVFAKRR